MPLLRKKTAPAAKKAAASTPTPAPTTRTVAAFASGILLSPVLTEKTAHLSDRDVVVFRVAPSANRITVGQAFKEIYGVLPIKVNIQRTHGKERRFGRVAYRRADIKRALITLPKGKRVDVLAV